MLLLHRWIQEASRRLGLTDISFHNLTEELGCLGVAGPKAQCVLENASNDFPENFPDYSSMEVSSKTIKIRLYKLGFF